MKKFTIIHEYNQFFDWKNEQKKLIFYVICNVFSIEI